MRKKADTTCNGQAQVKRPVTKSYDDMKQWDSSEDTTTRLSITLQLEVGSMGREAGNMTWTSFYCRSFPAVPPHKAEITCHKKPRHARPRYYCLPELERFWAKHVQWLLKAQSYAAELNDCSKPYSMHTNTSTRTYVCAPMYIYVYIYIHMYTCYLLCIASKNRTCKNTWQPPRWNRGFLHVLNNALSLSAKTWLSLEVERICAKHIQWLLKAYSHRAKRNDCSKPCSINKDLYRNMYTCTYVYIYLHITSICIYIYIYIYICIYVAVYVLYPHSRDHKNTRQSPRWNRGFLHVLNYSLSLSAKTWLGLCLAFISYCTTFIQSDSGHAAYIAMHSAL